MFPPEDIDTHPNHPVSLCLLPPLMMHVISLPLFCREISSSVNCGHVAANQSGGCATEFVNIGRNVVVALKSGRVETQPT